MIAIDLPEQEKPFGTELASSYPDVVEIIDGRSIDGTLTHWTLYISAAGLVIPAVRKVIEEILATKRHRTVTINGEKYQGYSAEEIAKIRALISAPRDEP